MLGLLAAEGVSGTPALRAGISCFQWMGSQANSPGMLCYSIAHACIGYVGCYARQAVAHRFSWAGCRHCLLQVDQLNAQVAQLTAAAEDKTKLEAALKASDKARLEAEEVVRQLRRHNSDTQRDVAKLQQELAGLALKQAKSGASASHELDTAMAMVGWNALHGSHLV